MNILAIETSCDDTSAAVISDSKVLCNVIASQEIHNSWGGIVPELASREHVKAIGMAVRTAIDNAKWTMDNVDAIAVTSAPGLPGSLHVGTQFAKGLALRHNKPLYPINHIEAHVYSGYLEHDDLEFPSVTLVVSGGHTALFEVKSISEFELLGSTKDDAAGEAFDKIAKLLGLGYPGGPLIDKLAQNGSPNAITFPRGLYYEDSVDFSFSGLKTAVKRYLEKTPDYVIEDVAASAQRAIVDVLVSKTVKACAMCNVLGATIAGGVSANSELRVSMKEACEKRGIRFVAPQMQYCVDNAAMIGFVAHLKHKAGVLPETDFRINATAIRSRW